MQQSPPFVSRQVKSNHFSWARSRFFPILDKLQLAVHVLYFFTHRRASFFALMMIVGCMQPQGVFLSARVIKRAAQDALTLRICFIIMTPVTRIFRTDVRHVLSNANAPLIT